MRRNAPRNAPDPRDPHRLPRDARPVRPRRREVGPFGGFGHDLKLVDLGRALPARRTNAVAAGVATADNHDDLAGRADRFAFNFLAGVRAVLLREVLHREVDVFQSAAGHDEVARLASAHR